MRFYKYKDTSVKQRQVRNSLSRMAPLPSCIGLGQANFRSRIKLKYTYCLKNDFFTNMYFVLLMWAIQIFLHKRWGRGVESGEIKSWYLLILSILMSGPSDFKKLFNVFTTTPWGGWASNHLIKSKSEVFANFPVYWKINNWKEC